MITQTIERLIYQGKAKYDTWSFGIAGAGTLRLDKNTFIIVTDFDYFHFIDEPVGIPTPAVSIATINTENVSEKIAYTLPSVATTDFVYFDLGNPGQTESDFQNAFSLAFLGWPLPTVSLSGTVWTIVVTTPTPGTAYNGIAPTLQLTDAGTWNATPFSGGSDAGSLTNQMIIDRSIHQLEFRMKNQRYSWIVKENFFFFPDQNNAFANITGVFQKKNLFIPFTEDMQIGIITVPPLSDWSIDYQPLDNKSNEPLLPAGYGQSTVANMNVVYNVQFDVAAPEQYIPVTKDRSDAPLNNYRPQFRVDYKNGRELNNPQLAETLNKGASQRFPIVNIGFYRINLNYQEFQKLF